MRIAATTLPITIVEPNGFELADETRAAMRNHLCLPPRSLFLSFLSHSSHFLFIYWNLPSEAAAAYTIAHCTYVQFSCVIRLDVALAHTVYLLNSMHIRSTEQKSSLTVRRSADILRLACFFTSSVLQWICALSMQRNSKYYISLDFAIRYAFIMIASWLIY